MFGLTKEEIMAELAPEKYIGRCVQQVEEFVSQCAMPKIQPYVDGDIQVEINL